VRPKKGILICNIGTPKSFAVEDVATYLREFLMDEEIINIPVFVRYPLVHWLIVPKRKEISAHNYKSIWSDQGSPLLVNTYVLQSNLQQHFGENYVIEIGMRYGEPSISQALRNFKSHGVKEVLALPLYPQYARATTESSYKKLHAEIQNGLHDFTIKKIPDFYAHPKFINALAESIQEQIGANRVDHYLMTYHGLPESQIKRIEGCLQSTTCCDQAQACEKLCYRAQCVKTSELLAKSLGLSRDQWSFSFQSRLGKTEWIKPYTEKTLEHLAKKGIKNLAVLCPSFISDCLETLEEIGVQGADIFKKFGGENFYLVPCLNERADYLIHLIQEQSF